MCLSRSCCKCDIASTTNTTNTSTANTCSTSSTEDNDNFQLSCPAVSDICSNATCHKTQNTTKSTQNARFCNLYKSRKTKSYVCLLIIVSAILVQTAFATPVQLSGQKLILHTSEYRQRYHQQLLKKERSTVQPTTKYHHHLHLRSITSDNMEESSFSCKSIAESLIKKANESQTITKELMRDYFNKYMQKKYPRVGDWRLHELKLEHPYQQVLERDLDKMPDKSRFADIVNTNMSIDLLKHELYKIYKTFLVLKKAFDEVKKNRENNKDRLMFDDRDNYAAITKFFNESSHYISVDIGEVRNIMEAMDLGLPEDIQKISTFSTSEDELLLAREYLSVGKHVCEIYKIFLSKCSS